MSNTEPAAGLSAGEIGRQAFLFAPGPTSLDDWQAVAAAIIAHHVGPGRMVVNRADVVDAVNVEISISAYSTGVLPAYAQRLRDEL